MNDKSFDDFEEEIYKLLCDVSVKMEKVTKSIKKLVKLF